MANNRKGQQAGQAKTDKPVDTALAIADRKLNAGVKTKYTAAVINPDLKWDTEKAYVMQILERNEFLAEVAKKNPISLVTAVLDCAALGLTLSPSSGYAYLVPKRPRQDAPYEVQLKISYKGMEQAVLQSGTVAAINTQLVYSNDEFDFGANENGPYMTFKMARGERGDLDGVFCSAKYANGEKYIEWMPIADINACEAASDLYSNGKNPAWKGAFKSEMQKKCCVRRADKHWPSSPVLDRINRIYDQESPMGFNTIDSTAVEVVSEGQIQTLRLALPKLTDDQFDVWLKRRAEAMEFASVHDVPKDDWDKFADGLKKRYAQMETMNQQAQDHVKTEAAS